MISTIIVLSIIVFTYLIACKCARYEHVNIRTILTSLKYTEYMVFLWDLALSVYFNTWATRRWQLQEKDFLALLEHRRRTPVLVAFVSRSLLFFMLDFVYYSCYYLGGGCHTIVSSFTKRESKDTIEIFKLISRNDIKWNDK